MLNDRPDLLAEYPFVRLNALLDGLAPGGEPAVLSIGEPQGPTPALIQTVLAANAHVWNKYPPVGGTGQWRAAVAAWLCRRYALPDAMISANSHVLPLSGSREGLYMVQQILVGDSGDGPRPLAVMPNPFYQPYLAGAVMSGAEPLMVNAVAATGHLPDYDALPEDVWDRAAVVILCSPANPQGAVVGLEQWKRMVTLAREKDVVLIADECYSEIYTGAPPPGALEACKALGGSLNNVLAFNSLSKRSGAPGLRSGFVVGDPDLIARFSRLRSYAAAGVPEPIQAVSAALWSDEAHVLANRENYRAKFAAVAPIIDGRFGFDSPAGGFFLWLNVGDGVAAAKRIWAETGVKVLPGAYLARDDAQGANCAAEYIRLALVHDRAACAAAVKKIVSVL